MGRSGAGMAYEATSERAGPLAPPAPRAPARTRAGLRVAARRLARVRCGAAWRSLAVAVYAALSVGAGGLPRPQRGALRRAGADPAARRLRRHGALAARPLGRRLVPDGRRRRVRERRLAAPALLPALPAAHRAALAELGGGSRGALLLGARTLVSLAAFLARAVAAATGSPRSSSAAGRGAGAAAAVRLPGVVVLRGAVLGEPVPARARWAPSTRRARAPGRGPASPAARRLGDPQRRACCSCCRWLYLYLLRRRARTGRGPDGARAAPATVRPMRWLPWRRWAWSPTRPTSGSPTATRWRSPRAQEFWGRDFAGPLVGVWDGLVGGLRRRAPAALGLARDRSTSSRPAGDPFRVAAMNLMLFGFLVLRASWRRSGCCGGCRSPTAPTWSRRWRCRSRYPVGPQPLMSLPRFLVVLFPIFMWLALVCEERARHDAGRRRLGGRASGCS